MVTRDIIHRLLNVINDTRRRVNTLESREAVLLTATQTLTNKTLTTPTIGNFTNAQHNHSNAAGGGNISLTNAVSGILPPANGGTGVNNDTRTLTINTNSGTLAFSGAGFTLTIPKTGTVPVGTGTAGRIAEWVTDANTVQASTLAKTGVGVLTLSAAGAYTLTVPATGTAALLGTANTFTANQTLSAGNALVINTPSSTANFRIGGLTGISDWGGVFINSTFNGTSWDLDKTTTDGYFFKLDVRQNTAGTFNGLWLFRIPNGANPHTDEYAAFGVTNGYGYFLENLLIGTTTNNAQLSVNQSSAIAAKPTLRLRQAALTEEFIRFDTTVGAGNPINTTALGTYYGRVRVWVEGVGVKWLALYNT